MLIGPLMTISNSYKCSENWNYMEIQGKYRVEALNLYCNDNYEQKLMTKSISFSFNLHISPFEVCPYVYWHEYFKGLF
jgi:hypothetical protein